MYCTRNAPYLLFNLPQGRYLAYAAYSELSFIRILIISLTHVFSKKEGRRGQRLSIRLILLLNLTELKERKRGREGG